MGSYLEELEQLRENGPVVRIGKFQLGRRGDMLWLEVAAGEAAGEGMQVTEAELEAAFDAFYSEHF